MHREETEKSKAYSPGMLEIVVVPNDCAFCAAKETKLYSWNKNFEPKWKSIKKSFNAQYTANYAQSEAAKINAQILCSSTLKKNFISPVTHKA